MDIHYESRVNIYDVSFAGAAGVSSSSLNVEVHEQATSDVTDDHETEAHEESIPDHERETPVSILTFFSSLF